VDNASTDDTALVLQNAHLPNLAMRCLREPRQGVSLARNRGLAAAGGEVILFTDDDVAPAGDWLERLATPLWQGDCDAAVGRIELAAELSRPWMQARHKRWLAAPDLSVDQMTELIGANMGFHRRVLARVPAFDPELGAGALGSGEETLFSFQLSEAGYRLRFIPDAVVVHHPDPNRLLRARWLEAARKQGRSLAYILHHWEHAELKWPFIRFCYMALKLGVRRKIDPTPPLDAKGIPDWEMSYLVQLEICRHFLQERKRPRNYTKHGLLRLGVPPGADPPAHAS
jgi:glycosyltransferase involved in cell wall biosynthesis